WSLAHKWGGEQVRVVGERNSCRHDNGCEKNHFDVVAGLGMGALRGQNPRAWNAPQRRRESEDPERYGTQAKQIARDVFGQSRNEEDDKAENHSFGFNDESDLVPDVLAHHLLNIRVSQPAATADGEERAER